MMRVLLAFARSQLRRLDQMTAVRIRNGTHLIRKLEGIPGLQLPVVPDDRTHVFFFFPILVRPEEIGFQGPVAVFREAFSRAMVAEGVPLASRSATRVSARSTLTSTCFFNVNQSFGIGSGRTRSRGAPVIGAPAGTRPKWPDRMPGDL